jgi:predicted thioredoxin/glutaredoxin
LSLCNEWLAELEKLIASAIKSQVYYIMIINTAVNCLSLTVKGGNGAYWIKVHAQLGEVGAERVFFLFSKLHILPRVL